MQTKGRGVWGRGAVKLVRVRWGIFNQIRLIPIGLKFKKKWF